MFVSIFCPDLQCTGSYYCSTLLVILSDEGDRPAENGVETALKYLAQTNKTNINKKSIVTLTGETENTTRDCEYLRVLV